ncbi:DNA cytosine methyltransferase [Segatella copri]|uniref:DNA cytosine methyltransferase n=1 Tax=Segatella copri TaxID=165179 RepID=UPI001291DA50|nr:DNA cytosine methyltransferase [Segatella copri]MQN15125.1 hypothetical protein [Segatella copri]
MPDNVDKLFEIMQAKGAASDRGKFRKVFLTPGNKGYKIRKDIYDGLRADGIIDSPTYEDFRRKLRLGGTPTVNKYRQQMFSSVDPNKSRASELTHRAVGQAVRATNNVRKPVTAKVVNRKGKPTGEEFAITPAKTVEDLDREYAQETTKNWENELNDQMADADKDAAKISDMFKSFIGSTDEVGSVWGNMTRGGGIAGTPHSVTTNNGILENTEARQILAAGDYNRKRRELLQLEQDSRNGAIFDNHSFFRGMYDAAKDTGLLTGGASDLINAGSLLATKQDLDNGVHTEAGDMLMQQAVKNSDAQSQYGDNQGWMYTGGVITTNMAPFMVQIGSAGFSKGMSNAIGKVVQGAASKVALGTMEKATGMVGAHIANYIGKVTGLTTKAFGKAIQYGIVGAAQANTVGLGNVANDVINRYTGQVYQDEQGNYKFGTFDSDGKLVHEGGEDFLTALVKGDAAQTIEFATELAGGGIDAVGTALKNFVSKGGKKIINKYNMENVSKVVDFLLNNKVSKNARYLKAGADRTLGKVELNSIVGESLEEELGIIANTVFTGDNKISDLWDEKQQSQIWGGMLLSIGLMKGAVAPFHAYNAKQYYSYKHKLDKADVNLSQLLGKEKWEELRNQIDTTTNDDMPEMVNRINRDVALGKNRQPVREYIQNLLIMRGYDIGNMLAAKKAVEDKGEGVSVKNMEKNQAYQQGRDAYGYDTHEIQLEQEDKQKSLAQLLGISEQQLASMSDEELEVLSGRDDNIDRAIYDYQLSTARYEGVIDNARDQIDLEVQRAAQAVDMYTDKSRNTIRNATIKATGGLEDYGVYIINGNIATHEDGSIDISNSDDMILYYDPTTNTVEHADAMMFAELGSEENADEVRSQAMADAKEKAIKETTGIIDGVVEVGTQFKTVDADGTEHTYEVLADNGDGTAMITIDGNVPTELVKGENVNIPVSFEELQKMKDESDQQRLQAAKAQREQMEKERAEQQMQAQTTQAKNPSQEDNIQPAPIEDNLDYSDIIREDGKVQMVDVSDKDGNNLFPDANDVFYIQGNKMRTKFAYIDANGELKTQSFPTGLVKIKTRGEVSVDDYKKYRNTILAAESSAMPETSMIEDNSGENRGGIEVDDNTQPLSETDADNVIAQMESSAEVAPDLELTPDNWAAEFGEDGIVSTPIGDVKMGENQVAKLFEKGRSKEFGMIKPTLTNPDVIIEVPSHSTDGNEERSSSYLFIKTFLGKNGKKVYYFKSVTIKKDGLEISISSHYDRAKRVKEALMKGKLLYRKNDGAQTEQNQPSASVTTSQEDAAGSSESKDTNISSNGNENNESLTFEDGTPIPVDESGETDLSQTDAAHAAEWYDNNLGEDADDWLDGEIKKAKKVLEQAKNKKLAGTKPSELVASKKDKEAAIADAQAHYDSAISIRDSLKERRIAKVEDTAEGRKELIEKARRKFARLKSAVKDDAEAVSQIYRETIGSLLHRLYDSTGIDVTDTTPLTAEEYVASNLGAHSLNYEGTETSKGVKQETGLSREDFAKTQLLAADGKGTTIDALVHSLWENRPSNLESLDTQDIRNALIGVLNSGFKASEARNFVENIRIAQAENILEEQKRAQENAAYAEQHKAEPEAELKAKSDEKAELKGKSEEKLDNESSNESNDLGNDLDNEKTNDKINDNINTPEVPEDATDENPLGLQLSEDKVPFEIEGGKSGETYDINDNEDRQRLINDNKVDDKDILDIDMPKHVHKAIKELCKKMGLKVQFLYMGAMSNGWIENGTMYLALDTEKATQFVFGHEMTHAIKQKNPEAYKELVKVAIAVTTKKKFEEDLAKVYQNYHGISGYNNVDDYVEEVVADNLGKFINDFDLAQKFSLRLNHPILGTILHAIQKIKSLLYGDFYKSVDALERIVEKAYVETANGQVTNSETGEDVSFSLRLKSAIEETETNPSDAQKESGNYKKGHIKFGGYDYTIENPKGSTRSGKDADGKEWKVTMHDTYGYIRGKFGKDGDHLDMFINDKADLDNWNGDVFVVDQVNPDGSFDEHKVMYGYDSMDDAKKAYLANYSDGWKGLGNITGASKDEFDKWLDTSKRKLKPFADYAKVKFSLKSIPVRFEAGKKLSDEEKKEVLSTLKDAYKVNGVPYHIEETAGGKEKRVYEPTADSYVVSDITNRPLRYYITLPDGRVAHPTEVYPNISDNEVKSSATKQGLLDEEVDQIVSAAIGNMKDIADNAKAIEVLTELQNLPHETHDVGYGMNNAQSYNYKTGIFTSDAAQAIDYVVRRMRRKEDVPTEIPAALKKAVADSYGMVDNLIGGMSTTKFSLKKVNDDFNQRLEELVKNPNQKDKILRLGRSSSFLKVGGITDAEIELDFDKFIRKSGDKYKNNHPFAASDLINLPMALAEPIAVFNSTTANDHVVLTELQKDGKNFIVAVRAVEQHRKGGVVLEVNKITSLYPKEERGIVYWINNGRISNVDKEKALHFIEALQPHAGTTITDEELKSAANIINSFETTKENGEKVDVEEPKTFDEFLNHPSLKFSIKNEQQRKAAEDAYEYASKLRPNKYAQYALVDMSNPSNSPQYYEKRVLADRWRRFYNKAVHNELDDVYKDAWGNYKLFDLDRPFADQVNEVKGDVPNEFNAPDVVANKNADNESGAEYHEYKQDEPSSITYKDRYKAFKQREANREKTAGLRKERKEVEDVYKSKSEERVEYNKQLMKEYMDEHGLSSENDIPYDVWDNLRSKSFEKYQDELDSLFNKYKDLDKQIKAVAEPRFSLKDEKIKSVAEKFGVNEDDVAMYANAVEKGSTAEAARARANIKRYLLQANEDKISSFKELMKYTVPVNEALKENFGDLDAMIEERRKQIEAERNAMEAARKRAQEEEEKRQKHLDELSLIPTDELDKRYMDAIANNDESTAREMLDESARRKGYGDVDSDYQGQGAWAAPSNPQYESDEARRADIENSPDVNLEDIALGYSLQPDDYFDNPRAYMNNTAYGLESAHVIKNALDAIKNGEKDVKVKVYRAVPTSVKEGKLRNGDWVTPSKKYAEMHGDNRLEGKYRIIEDEVPANQLWWDGNDANEFGFDDGKEYRYKNAKNNRKLNDLITYDNKGNVIPPSKRFNSRKNDIRFSLAGERGVADMAEDLKSLNTPDEVDDAIKTAIEDMPSGWKMANKKMIHIVQALGENRKAEIAGEEPKFSLKDGTLIKAGTYFSGGGLVEEGLKGIIDPVVAVEYDEKISGVYRNNFGQHIVTADVRDVDPKELVKQIDGEVEYFHASPVCKNYSQAKSNHAEVELDKETAASTAEFINAIKPKVVTIENVKGYKDSDAMKTITDALDANGYTWDADVYNAADYGGYTNRERLIVRAVRDGKLPEKPKKMAHKSGWYEAVADIIPTLTEKKNGVAPWMDIRLKADGIDWRNIDKPLYVMGSAYADGKIPHAFADELLPTLRTKSGDVIVMPDGKVYRAMGRVLARVSGVSDDYKMPFSENLSHTIIGNGIPTQLTEHVIAPLLQNILRPTTPEDGNTKFSLRGSTPYGKQMEEWMEKNHLEKGAVPMEKPIMKEGENIFDYANRMVEWTRNQNLWKTAPKQTGFQDALDKWKADNGLSPDAYPPVRPHRENYSTEIGYAEDLEEYNKKKELWKSAPKPKDFDLSVDLEDMNKQLRNIRRAVLNQKNYDQRTVKAVSDLVRKMLNIGWGDGLSRGKVGNLLSAAKNATGANDVKKYLDKAMGILAENYLNRLSTAYDNLINTKGARADQSGVIKMGSLDANGQAFMSEYKKAINMDDSSLNTYIANIEEDSAKNEDNVEMNDYRLAGIQAAIMYKQQIGGNDADISELKRQIGELKNKKDATKEDKDLLKSLEKKLFENKFDRITMYENLLNNIQRMVKESKGRAKKFREEIAEHKNEILHRANLDLEGVDSTYYDTTTAKKKLVNNDLQRAVFSSTYTFEQFLKFFGKKSANGEGYLYNYFTKLNQDALDEEQLYNEMNRNALDEKTKELFGKEKFMKLVGIDGKGMKEMDVEVTDYSNKETGKRTIHLKQGQMLYIYLVNKETDGEMKLRAMGITEEDVAAIEENLDPRVKAMGEWLQDEYLPECQRRYQATHTKYFGAPMKEVENYFPLAINNRARNVKEDVNQDSDAMSQLAGTSTGAIVTRRVNVIPLDIENADAFEVAFNHLQEMEEWSAMLPFRQDINTLLSYTHFRNQVQNMSSVAYGSGKTLWDEFKQTAQIAAGTYKPKVNAGMMDSRIAAAMGGIAVAKISGRLWTAIKQSQSATVFLPECDFTRFVKNGVNPYGSWKWAMENIPDFRKRVENMTYGDVKLRQYLDELEKWHDWTKTISKIGMAPNILVDGITCAVGARSVYETEVNRLTKLGYPKEKAEEKAYYKSVAAYNKTQQSSGGMYLSPMQVDRTYASAALSLFKNANYAYGRMQIEACRGLARTYDFWGGKHKTALIESMTRQIMEEDGLDENTARAIAKATYNRTFRQSIGRLINFATLVPVSWALYKVLPYLLTGDDDDKKKDMIEEAVLKGFATSLSDNYVIPFASNILNAGLKVEDGKPTFDPEVFKWQNLYINPATSDLANIYSMVGNQKWYSVANKLGMLGVQSLIGFNPETVGALYQAFAEADKNNGNTAKEWQIGILKAISAPEESIRELYMDELGLKSGDIKKIPLAELEKRYAERQINRDNLLSQIFMDAETFNGYVDKYQQSFEKKIKDKMDKWDEYDKKKADEFFDTTSDPKLKDMIEKKRAKDANAAADEQIAKEGLNQEKKGKEPSEEAYDAVKMSIDVAEDNAISTYNKVLNKRYAALNDEYNNQTDAMKYIFMSKHPNFKSYKDLESEYTTYGKKMKELKEKLVSADGYDAKQTILKQIRAKREKFSELQSKVR